MERTDYNILSSFDKFKGCKKEVTSKNIKNRGGEEGREGGREGGERGTKELKILCCRGT